MNKPLQLARCVLFKEAPEPKIRMPLKSLLLRAERLSQNKED
eukprot:CAMPEP_0181432066 /NCGR_PEP_ID=MMETSP1110-20121109/18575_1 /TAXON_ID=174948 /ORGANISM="Symbiodinium sp., Strain CCMP421" /LENGTH=41 /DNA_ID= /DNA_START= /DNA_END= /DNA_ORIENTATION=